MHTHTHTHTNECMKRYLPSSPIRSAITANAAGKARTFTPPPLNTRFSHTGWRNLSVLSFFPGTSSVFPAKPRHIAAPKNDKLGVSMPVKLFKTLYVDMLDFKDCLFALSDDCEGCRVPSSGRPPPLRMRCWRSVSWPSQSAELLTA